jgi:hypothetical protein
MRRSDIAEIEQRVRRDKIEVNNKEEWNDKFYKK